MGSCWIDPADTTVYPTQPASVPDFDIRYLRNVNSFPPNRWGGDFEALIALAEFARTDWLNQVVLPDPPGPGTGRMIDEIKEPFNCSRRSAAPRSPRSSRKMQIFHFYFLGLLSISSCSHRQTYLLLKIAARIGEMMMAKFKIV